MYQLKVFHKILEHTARAIFDMCQFGLRIPHTDRFIRKRSQVFTTSKQVFLLLDQKLRQSQHQHHRIEGSHRFPGLGVQRVSRFCASYCQGFARRIAREICSHVHVAVSPDQMVCHNNEDLESPAKKPRFSQNLHKRQKTEHDDSDKTLPLTNPEADVNSREDPNPDEKNASSAELPTEAVRSETDPWSAVLEEANKAAPRVGNTKCEADSQTFQMAQRLVPDLCIQSLFVCRGTDRFQTPLSAPTSKEFTHSSDHLYSSQDW